MRFESARPWIGTVVRLALGVIWIWASLDKLSSPRTFVQAVRAYDATPEWLSKGIGYGLPVVELSLGVLLVLGVATRVAAAVSGLLFLVFLIGLVQAAIRGIQIECGCFGGGGTTTGGTTYTLDILRDIGLIVLAAFLVVWPLTRLSLDEYIARNDRVERPSAKRMRTEQGRKKYNAMLEARRKEARSRDRWIAASLGGVVVLVAVIGIGVQANRAKIEGSLAATNASVDSGIVFGKKAAATVDIYEDIQCPNCRNFEQEAGKTIEAAVRANKAQVRYHVISLSSLDTFENGYYSSRGANAAYCASDVSVDYFVAWQQYMYGKVNGKNVQPDEGAGGLANTEIETLATKVRNPSLPSTAKTDFNSCVENQRHKALVQAITDKASQDGVNGTPTVKVNGKTIDNSAAAFTAAVNKALKNGPAPQPSKTPSPKPSSSTPATTGSSSASPKKTTSSSAAG
ncbi:MauE/DoxX family redox-associated membrane protein [Jatrophihabitans fulvus]